MAAISVRTPVQRQRGESSQTVPEQLRRVLRELRERGLLFEEAWEVAAQRVIWPESERELLEWDRALAGTMQTWRAQYEGWDPTPSEAAVRVLLDALRARQLAS